MSLQYNKTMPAMIDLTGQRYGRLVVRGLANHRSPSGRILWLCDCDCGNEVIAQANNLRSTNTQSCGCLAQDNRAAVGRENVVHGHAGTRTYASWRAMKKRCYNPNNPSYEYYGGRGIRVCKRWFHSFELFLADMGIRPYHTTLDRIDPNGHYTPSNCRWASAKDQAANRRPR